jgi:hypothetical protein
MIHYHGTPMTPVQHMARAFGGRHAMVSFERPDQIEVAAEVCQSVALDNGAYSAWVHKREYDFNGYLAWCRQWLRHPAVDWCVIPDEIDGDERINNELIDSWPLAPAVSVPVWHLHESLGRLKVLAETFPRVAMGSSGEFSQIQTPQWWQRMGEALNAISVEGMPVCKLHGLRMLDPVIFSHIPLSSADSCNVAIHVGMDHRWSGPYAPTSKWVRALVLMDRIESHASAARWCGSNGVQLNLELAG